MMGLCRHSISARACSRAPATVGMGRGTVADDASPRRAPMKNRDISLWASFDEICSSSSKVEEDDRGIKGWLRASVCSSAESGPPRPRSRCCIVARYACSSINNTSRGSHTQRQLVLVRDPRIISADTLQYLTQHSHPPGPLRSPRSAPNGSCLSRGAAWSAPRLLQVLLVWSVRISLSPFWRPSC